MKKVNVLGTEYSLVEDSGFLKEINADGIHKQYEKEIAVRSLDDYLCADDKAEAKKLRMKEVIRHELTHAFFCESGLSDYMCDEQLVDWIAIQFPKMLKVFEEAECL